MHSYKYCTEPSGRLFHSCPENGFDGRAAFVLEGEESYFVVKQSSNWEISA